MIFKYFMILDKKTSLLLPLFFVFLNLGCNRSFQKTDTDANFYSLPSWKPYDANLYHENASKTSSPDRILKNENNHKKNLDPIKDQKANEQDPALLTGTGWTVSKGYVVTSLHVVEKAKKIILLTKEGNSIEAITSFIDSNTDVALLIPKEADLLPPALPLSIEDGKLGTSVFTIGFPHPEIMGFDPKLTNGTLSATSGLGGSPRFYQISVPVQSGNSGGPLLNSRGEVVGIIAAKLKSLEVAIATGDLPENVNYSVKSSYIKNLIDKAPDLKKQIPLLSISNYDLETLASDIEGSILLIIVQK